MQKQIAIIGEDPDLIVETAIKDYLVGGKDLKIGNLATTQDFIDNVTTSSFGETPFYCMGIKLTKTGSKYMLYYSDKEISIGQSGGFVQGMYKQTPSNFILDYPNYLGPLINAISTSIAA